MDRKLLLAVQWACNKKSVKVPWEMIGREMGETITESAVVQHLAKLRTRMVNEGLPVPPPLTRGGRSTKATARPANTDKVKTGRVTKRGGEKKKAVKKSRLESDTEEEYHTKEEDTPVKKKGKKKSVKKSRSESDTEDEYRAGEEDSPVNKKGKKKAEKKSRVKKEPSSPDQIKASDGSDNEKDQEFDEEAFAVGDAMWDLNVTPNAYVGHSRASHSHASPPPASRSQSSQSSSSSQPANIVILKIGQDGFSKLGIPTGNNEHLESSYDSDEGSVAEGSLKSAASNNAGSVYGLWSPVGSQGSIPHTPVYAGAAGGYNEEYADTYAPSKSQAHETQIGGYNSYGSSYTNNFEDHDALGEMNYDQMDGSAIDDLSSPESPQILNADFNGGLSLPSEPFVNNPNTAGKFPGAGQGVDEVSSSAGNGSFPEATVDAGVANKHEPTMNSLNNHHGNRSSLFDDGCFGTSDSNTYQPNAFGAALEENSGQVHHGTFNLTSDNVNVGNQGRLPGNGHPDSSAFHAYPGNVVTFFNDTGITPHSAVGYADSPGLHNMHSNYDSTPHGLQSVRSGGHGYEGHDQWMRPQHMGSQILGSHFDGPIGGNHYAHDRGYGSFGPAQDFTPLFNHFDVLDPGANGDIMGNAAHHFSNF